MCWRQCPLTKQSPLHCASDISPQKARFCTLNSSCSWQTDARHIMTSCYDLLLPLMVIADSIAEYPHQAPTPSLCPTSSQLVQPNSPSPLNSTPTKLPCGFVHHQLTVIIYQLSIIKQCSLGNNTHTHRGNNHPQLLSASCSNLCNPLHMVWLDTMAREVHKAAHFAHWASETPVDGFLSLPTSHFADV